MLQITPQMKILVAVEPTDFRRGIDGLARHCQATLRQDPFVGAVFVFRNRKGTALRPFGKNGWSGTL
jgi:transposase